jgi:hypothetical protein
MIDHNEFELLAIKHGDEADRSGMSGLSAAEIDLVFEYAANLANLCSRTRKFLERMANVEECDTSTLFDLRERFRGHANILKKARAAK